MTPRLKALMDLLTDDALDGQRLTSMLEFAQQSTIDAARALMAELLADARELADEAETDADRRRRLQRVADLALYPTRLEGGLTVTEENSTNSIRRYQAAGKVLLAATRAARRARETDDAPAVVGTTEPPLVDFTGAGPERVAPRPAR